MIPLEYFPEHRILKPRMRPSVVIQTVEDRIRFLCFADLRELEFTVEPFVIDLVKLCDGEHDVAEIHALLTLAGHCVSTEEVKDIVCVLATSGLLDRSVDHSVIDERHNRQSLFFSELLSSNASLPASVFVLQQRLASARVLVLGVGGAGSWVVRALCAAGVGTITVVDPDVVEISNLDRQALFELRDVGRHKVDALVERCGNFAPDTTVVPIRKWVNDESDLLPYIEDMTLVVGCADVPSVNVVADLVANLCEPRGIAHIVGGSYGGNLGIPGTTVIPSSTVCWACIRAQVKSDHEKSGRMDLLGRSGPTGSIGAITGVVANVMAWDAIRVLLGMAPGLANGIREFDIMSLEWRFRSVPKQPGCSCGSQLEKAPDVSDNARSQLIEKGM